MHRLLVILVVTTAALARAAEPPADAPAQKAPPERTYSDFPFVHRIVLLDEDGAVIRPAKPGEDPAAAGTPAGASIKPMSQAKTCGKCHSDYDVMTRGLHFNFSDPNVPRGRPGEPWILTDPQTRTQLPLSYRRWDGTFHPHDVGLNDFNFARLFGRHHPGGGALATSSDLRFNMSGQLEIDCLICHTSDDRYDPVARANAITNDQNFKYAPTLAAFLGKVQGQASRLRDNFDPTGPDARRAPKVNYDPARFDDMNHIVLNIERHVSNDRCYYCHTNIDVGRAPLENAGLEGRWRHDQDIHLAKGMSCVDCHRHGADHMMVRGYEGEFKDRAGPQPEKAEQTITTLSCAGCHYGTESFTSGRHAAPRPLHRGMPTRHIDKRSCTACHSGPTPTDATSLVQTAMAHKLGLPRHHTVDAAAPTIQQPVFMRAEGVGKFAPFRILYPSFWARLDGHKLTPILPEHVLAAGVDAILGEKPDPKHFVALQPLTKEQILQVLDKLSSATPQAVKPADAIDGPATSPTTTATTTTTAPATTQPSPAGEVVFVTGGTVYPRDGKGGLKSTWAPGAGPYAWPVAHPVRSAQQSLGARGCTECHSNGAPFFDGAVSSASIMTDATLTTPMHAAHPQSIAPLRVLAATYPLRWPLIVIGYFAAGVLLLVLLKRTMNAIGARG